VIDGDEVVRVLWQSEEMISAARKRFGEKTMCPGGAGVDRRLLAEAVFSNESDYIWACNLLHPAALREIKERVARSSGWVVVEIPLLYEVGKPDWIDFVVYVTANIEKRIARTENRGWDSGELEKREKWLMPVAEKTQLADIVLENEGEFAGFEMKVKAMGQKIKRLSLSGEWRRTSDERNRKRILEAIVT
jgi:dephospho-CoA kinase